MKADRFEPAYAIIRVDLYKTSESWENRITVKCIMWDLGVAEQEVKRLSELNEEKGCYYFYQYTRVLSK